MSNFFKVASQSQLPLIDGISVFVGDLGYTMDSGGFWDAVQPSAPPGATPVWSFVDILRGPPGPQGEVGVGLPGPQGQIGPPGLMGGRGPQGPAGQNAFSLLSTVMRVPALTDPPYNISVTDTSWMTAGLLIYIPGAGTFTVIGTPTDPHVATIANSGDPNNSPSGTMVGAGTAVSAANMRGPTGPSGIPGPPGPQGPQGVSGSSAFSSLSQAYTFGDTSTPTIAFVQNSAPFSIGQIVYVEGGDYCSVLATNATNNSLTLQNLGYTGTAVGTVIPIGNTVSGTGPRGPAGPQGATGPQGAQGIQGVALTGTIAMWGTPTAPGGWILCQGQAVSKTQYSALYSIISDAFRNPSNSDQSTFNVPNFQGVFPIGANSTYPLASTGGRATVTLVTANLASHTHTMGNHTHLGADHLHSLQNHTHGMDHYHLIGAGQFNHTHSDSGHTHTYGGAFTAGSNYQSGNQYGVTGNNNTGTGYANIQPNTLPQGNTVYASQTNGAWANTGGPSSATTGAADRGLTTGGPSTNTSDATGSATPFAILPPYLAVNFIIKA